MHDAIVRLIVVYADACGLSNTYASRRLTGSGDTITRLRAGAGLTLRRAEKITQTASDHWPLATPWPADIPRPEPAPDSPALREHAKRVDDPLAAVEALIDELDGLMTSGRWDAAQAAELRMFKVAGTLGDDGRIKSPKALCRALGARRSVYEDVCKRYSRGRAGRARPRQGSDAARMLALLEQSGDERFRAGSREAA